MNSPLLMDFLNSSLFALQEISRFYEINSGFHLFLHGLLKITVEILISIKLK
jgi:hypothetical protein